MTVPPPSLPAQREPHEPALWLSAAADGEADALPHAQRLWRDDADARERWHLYHLIGDVMRSDELASVPARDAAFLAGLRTRLADEPVPLAPSAAASPPAAGPAAARHVLPHRLGWRAPAAVAAGFVAVAAATLVLVRPEGFGGEAPSPSLASPQLAGNDASVIDGRMLRDARLDAYLAAHQSFGGGSPAAWPGGGLMRRVELGAPVAPPVLMPVVPVVPMTAAPASHPGSAPR